MKSIPMKRDQRRAVLAAKKKKDFKLSEKVITEFEELAPPGKQTAIVEELIAEWVARQKRQAVGVRVMSVYQKESTKKR